MNSFRACVVSLILVCSLASLGHAQVVRYDITGFVTFADDSASTTATSLVFGAQANAGSPVAGFFELDLSAPQTGSSNFGGLSGSVSTFDFNSPLNVVLNLGGIQFESDGTYVAAVANDLVDPYDGSAFDGFAVGDGLVDATSGTLTGLSGTTFLADGIPISNGTFALQFIDTTASLFNSTSLPTSLDLADFDLVDGLISSFDDGASFRQISFSIDTLEVASVPEPSGLVLLLMAATGYTTLLRRR